MANSVSDLIRKVSKTGTEIFLYYGHAFARPDGKMPAELHEEFLRRNKEIATFLASRIAAARAAVGPTHKWILRLGDAKAKNGIMRPAYLACGPVEWCTRLVRQAQELADQNNQYERLRWLILEQDQVGAAIKNERGFLIASMVVLPEGVHLGGPAGSKAEILSACDSCLTPPMPDERTDELLKNES